MTKKKPIKLSKREWDRIAKCIIDITCGCIWSNYGGKNLKRNMENY